MAVLLSDGSSSGEQTAPVLNWFLTAIKADITNETLNVPTSIILYYYNIPNYPVVKFKSSIYSFAEYDMASFAFAVPDSKI